MDESPASLSREIPVPSVADYLRLILSRWKTVISVAFSVTIITIAWNLLTAPVYEARTILQVGEERSLNLFSEFPMFQNRLDPLLSEVEILKSRTIAEEVVKNLNLQVRLRRVPKRLNLKVDNITLNENALIGTYTVDFNDDQGQFLVFDEGGKVIARGIVGTLLKTAEFSFIIQEACAQEGDKFQIVIFDFNKTVASLQKRTFTTSKRNTSIVEVKIHAPVAQEAADIANTLAKAYIKSTAKRRSMKAFSTKEYIGKQLETVKLDLKAAEEILSRYKTDKGIIAMSEEAKQLIEQMSAEEVERAKYQAQRQEAEAILKILRSPQDPSKPLVISTAGIVNPLLLDLARHLNSLSLERVRLSRGLASGHTAMIGMKVETEEAKRKLIEEVEATINSLRERELAFANVLQRYDAELKKLPETELGLVSLFRTSKVNENLYTVLVQKYEEARIAEASEIGNAWVVDTAIAPEKPFKPNIPQNLAFGILMGLFLGLGVTFFLEHLDRSIRSVRDLELSLGIPTFGIIPKIPSQPSKILSPEGDGHRVFSAALKLIHRMDPRTFAAEAYRSLRTNIQFAMPDVKEHCLLLTSTSPGEGKSLTCANLGIALAQGGRRVILMDADLRRPTQHRLFEIRRDPGLSEVLAGKVSWREVVQKTEVENLAIFPSGPPPPNPVELLASGRMKELLHEIAQEYELVLVDSPPILPFTDGAVLGTVVNGVFLVVRYGVTAPEAVQRAKMRFQGVGSRILGAILNGASIEQSLGLTGSYRSYYDYRRQEDGGVTGRWKRLFSGINSISRFWRGRRKEECTQSKIPSRTGTSENLLEGSGAPLFAKNESENAEAKGGNGGGKSQKSRREKSNRSGA